MWYGVCDSTRYYCSYNGSAKILKDSQALNALTEYCPHLVNNSGDTSTCCDGEQVIWNMVLEFKIKISIVITDWAQGETQLDLQRNECKFFAEHTVYSLQLTSRHERICLINRYTNLHRMVCK